MIKLDRLPMLCLVGVISFSLPKFLDTISFISSLADAVSHFEKDPSHLIDNKNEKHVSQIQLTACRSWEEGDDDAST